MRQRELSFGGTTIKPFTIRNSLEHPRANKKVLVSILTKYASAAVLRFTEKGDLQFSIFDNRQLTARYHIDTRRKEVYAGSW